MSEMKTTLSECQLKAMEILNEGGNVFISGSAGSGKSFLVSEFLKKKDRSEFPIVASTGASAILVGGRTFHSFFGIGIMEGGVVTTVARALKNKRLLKRLADLKGVIIDEISMIPGQALKAAEEITRKARGKTTPWGGLQVIAVGDFSQLPPVSFGGRARDWAFLDNVWNESQFQNVFLKTVMRTKDPEFLKVLEYVRLGIVNREVTAFLDSKKEIESDAFEGTRLFPRRDAAENYNLTRLGELKGDVSVFETEYAAKKPEFILDMKKHMPIPEKLVLKKNAMVMLRQNDVEGRYVNGSLGTVKAFQDDFIEVKLFTGKTIHLEKASFTLFDEEGNEKAVARNFPLTLAYATTIHKSQGMTIDKLRVDLKGAWEHGQTYVALSRVEYGKNLSIVDWSPRSVVVDPVVRDFFLEG